MNKNNIVVSLGHEALGYTTNEQLDRVKVTAKVLASLAKEYNLTITHSNGPQISMIHKAMTTLNKFYDDYTNAPMCVCNAMSQGYVGFDLQNSLRCELLKEGISKSVSTILTQVTVDPYDEAFYSPNKAIGGNMTKTEAEAEISKGNYVSEEDGSGFKRVIASPSPISIVEIDAIKALVDANQIVIACGGGGIPVIEQSGLLKGASAVIEKDATAGLLASELNVDLFVILTSVDQVYKNYGKANQEAITSMTVTDAKEYILAEQFGVGTMLPKIEAAINYLGKVPSGKVLITSMSRIKDAIQGKGGTLITNC